MTVPRNIKKVCSRVGLALVLLLGIWLVGLILLEVVAVMLVPHWLKNPWLVFIMNDIPLYLLGFPVLLLVLARVPNGPRAPRPKVKFGVGKLLLCLLFSLGVAYIVNYVSLFFTEVVFNGMLPSGGALDDLLGANDPWATFVFGVCVPAFGEEFIFRYLLRRKLRGAADKTFILISGLTFGLFHAYFSQMAYAFILGMVLAWMYTITENMLWPIALHFLFNFIGGVFAPMAAENTALMVVMGIVVIACIALAFVLFFVCRRWAYATMLPPSEAGWGFKPASEKTRRRQAEVFANADPAVMALYGLHREPCPGLPYGAYTPQPYAYGVAPFAYPAYQGQAAPATQALMQWPPPAYPQTGYPPQPEAFPAQQPGMPHWQQAPPADAYYYPPAGQAPPAHEPPAATAWQQPAQPGYAPPSAAAFPVQQQWQQAPPGAYYPPTGQAPPAYEPPPAAGWQQPTYGTWPQAAAPQQPLHLRPYPGTPGFWYVYQPLAATWVPPAPDPWSGMAQQPILIVSQKASSLGLWLGNAGMISYLVVSVLKTLLIFIGSLVA